MSKAEGKKIGIKFTLPILPVDATPETIIDDFYSAPVGIATRSSQYNSYGPERAFDGDISSFWYTRISGMQWVQIELFEPRSVAGFQMYSTTSFSPNGVDLYGSNDGVNFDLIVQTTNANATGWKEHIFTPTTPYKFYKWEVVSRYSSYLWVYEFQLKFAEVVDRSGNENAFNVTGQEYDYTDGPDNNGPLLNKTYPVKTVRTHPTETNAILLEFDNTGTFRSVAGAITINYNQSLGALAGTGGAVQSFDVLLMPADLQEQGDPRVREYITVVVNGSIDLVHITKANAYSPDEYINVGVAGTIQLIHIDDINP